MIPDFYSLDQPVSDLIRRVSRDLILPAFSSGISEKQVRYKNDHSVVTEIDIQSQQIFESSLLKLLPTSCIVGEEVSDYKPSINEFKSYKLSWIVDAVDGTHRFVSNQPDFTTMICLCVDQEPYYGWIYLPTEDRLFSGGQAVGVFDNGKKITLPPLIKSFDTMIGTLSPSAFSPYEKQVIKNCQIFEGIRYHLCAGYKFAGLLTNALDFAVFGRAAPWDLAAGFALIKAIGGHAATWQRGDLDLALLWDERREWYLATANAADWQQVKEQVFTEISIF